MTARVWAFGGGKGGVGKSLVCAVVGAELARRGLRVVALDADLGAANLHTLLGVLQPARTLDDFVRDPDARLEDVCLETEVDGLRLVSGAAAILRAAHPRPAERARLIDALMQQDVDAVLLDLGAGTHYATLDLFNLAGTGLVVTGPEPTSIQNAYAFLKAALFRRIELGAGHLASVREGLARVVRPRDAAERLDAVGALIEALRATDAEAGEAVAALVSDHRGRLVVNQGTAREERRVLGALRVVCQRYLDIELSHAGTLPVDAEVRTAIRRMKSVARAALVGPLAEAVRPMVDDLLAGDRPPRPDLLARTDPLPSLVAEAPSEATPGASDEGPPSVQDLSGAAEAPDPEVERSAEGEPPARSPEAPELGSSAAIEAGANEADAAPRAEADAPDEGVAASAAVEEGALEEPAEGGLGEPADAPEGAPSDRGAVEEAAEGGPAEPADAEPIDDDALEDAAEGGRAEPAEAAEGEPSDRDAVEDDAEVGSEAPTDAAGPEPADVGAFDDIAVGGLDEPADAADAGLAGGAALEDAADDGLYERADAAEADVDVAEAAPERGAVAEAARPPADADLWDEVFPSPPDVLGSLDDMLAVDEAPGADELGELPLSDVEDLGELPVAPGGVAAAPRPTAKRTVDRMDAAELALREGAGSAGSTRARPWADGPERGLASAADAVVGPPEDDVAVGLESPSADALDLAAGEAGDHRGPADAWDDGDGVAPTPAVVSVEAGSLDDAQAPSAVGADAASRAAADDASAPECVEPAWGADEDAPVDSVDIPTEPPAGEPASAHVGARPASAVDRGSSDDVVAGGSGEEAVEVGGAGGAGETPLALDDDAAWADELDAAFAESEGWDAAAFTEADAAAPEPAAPAALEPAAPDPAATTPAAADAVAAASAERSVDPAGERGAVEPTAHAVPEAVGPTVDAGAAAAAPSPAAVPAAPAASAPGGPVDDGDAAWASPGAHVDATAVAASLEAATLAASIPAWPGEGPLGGGALSAVTGASDDAEPFWPDTDDTAGPSASGAYGPYDSLPDFDPSSLDPISGGPSSDETPAPAHPTSGGRSLPGVTPFERPRTVDEDVEQAFDELVDVPAPRDTATRAPAAPPAGAATAPRPAARGAEAPVESPAASLPGIPSSWVEGMGDLVDDDASDVYDPWDDVELASSAGAAGPPRAAALGADPLAGWPPSDPTPRPAGRRPGAPLPDPPSHPSTGIDEAVTTPDGALHVQTTDLAPTQAFIRQSIFREGRLVHRVDHPYEDLLDPKGTALDPQRVPARVESLHRQVIEATRRAGLEGLAQLPVSEGQR